MTHSHEAFTPQTDSSSFILHPSSLFGVDYYPEHWPEERWPIDARLMCEAGISVVRVGEFGWSRLEPEAGQLNFDWLDRAIEVLAAEGLKVIVGTPSAAPPAWMVQARPDILPVAQDGRIYGFGGRRHYCPSSAYYRTQTMVMARLMAAHYANNAAVIGWQIDNEMGNHGTTRCYCPRCHDKFRNWLRQRYQTLEALNQDWGTVFWSQEYTDWSQIPLPVLAPTDHTPSLALDYRRFSSDNAVEFFELQIDAIREYFPPERGFITHNIMPLDDTVNFYDLSRRLDFISWDNYPHGGSGPEQVTFHHDWIWGFLRRPTWIMEQQLGPINWTAYNPPVPPGQARLWSAYNQAKGAEGTVYFRWRESRFGQEQYHSAFLRHDAYPARAYHELKEAHQELNALPADYHERGPAQVALLFSYDDLWAFQLDANNAAFSYSELVRDIHGNLRSRHIPCDILPRGSALEILQQYRLVIAPAAHLIDEAENRTWQAYVNQGGKLLLTMRSGVKLQSNVWTEESMPGGLTDFLGAYVEEGVSFPPPGAGKDDPKANWGWREWTDKPVTVEIEGQTSAEARRLWLETLSTDPGLEVLARFGQSHPDDYFAGSPALLRRQQGEGAIYYLACWPQESLYTYLWQEVFKREARPVAPNLPRLEGLEAVASGRRGQYLTLFNHSSYPLHLPLPEGYIPLKGVTRPESIPPHGILFLKRAG